MEYRDQLKYIKSHQTEERNGKKRRKKKKRISPMDHFLWMIQFLASVFFVVSMVILGIVPKIYMYILTIILILMLILIKVLQKRSCRSKKKRGSGKILSFLFTTVFVVVGFYGIKVNAALDKIAIGEESGGYGSQHAIPVTEAVSSVRLRTASLLKIRTLRHAAIFLRVNRLLLSTERKILRRAAIQTICSTRARIKF